MRPRFPSHGIVECPRCALVFYAGAVSADALYGQSYFAGGEYLDYRADRNVLQRNFRRHLPLLERWAPSGRLLELGCAYGFFLQIAAARWLKPGGTLVLTTGDVESRLARLQGERWRQVHPPTHLFYFSPATLRRTATRAGLETIHSSHVGHSRGYRAMLYGLFALGGKRTAWIYRLLTAGGRLDFPIYLNVYDIILFAARKPDGSTGAAGAPR